MKLIYMILPTAMLFCQLSVATCQHIENLPELIEKNLPSVVKIKGHSKQGMPTLGTGFLIDDRGYCVTNYHVIDNKEFIQIVTYDSQVYESAQIIAQSQALDLVVFTLRNPMEMKFSTVTISNEVPRIGEPVFVIGHPGSPYEWTTHTGIVSGVHRREPYPVMIQTSVAVAPGNSGSPLFNSKGEVIGIISIKGAEHVRNISLAIPVKHMQELKSDTGEKPFVFTDTANLIKQLRILLDISHDYRKKKEYDYALETLLSFARKHAEQLPVRRQIELYQEIAQVYSAAGDVASAYSYFDKVYQLLRPMMIEAYKEDTVSWMRVFSNDPQLHITVFTTLMHAGMCQIRLGMYSEADNTLAHAISEAYYGLKLLPEQPHVYMLFLPQIHYSRALADFGMGKIEEGCAQLRHAVKLGNKDAQKLIREQCK